MATALSFYGDSEQVGPFMQTASHKTRAYYINANGFSGFVVKSVIIDVLTKAFEQKQLVEAAKFLHIDSGYVLQKLVSLKTNNLRVRFLGEEYPRLIIFVLKKLGKVAALQ